MNKNALKNLLCSLLILPLLLSGCNKSNKTSQNEDPIYKTEVLMGTVCTVKIYDSKDTSILDKAFNRIKEIENEVSINKEATELDKVNSVSGINKVNVKDDTYTMIKEGKKYSEMSSGAFDITIGPLVKLWGIGTENAKLPTDQEINEKKALIGYKDLELNDSDKSVYLKRKGMIIDLGGIAKGYTADEIAKVLKANNVNKAIIDLGGNIFALGDSPKNVPWKIGIQNPYLERGGTIGYIEESNKSVVTSGIYERYFEKDGKRYHHILSPFSGYPYDNEIAGVSIISDKSIDGDALSTTTFALGVDKGLDFINKIHGVEAIFITKNKEVYVTPGIKNNFKLTNEEFTLKN